VECPDRGPIDQVHVWALISSGYGAVPAVGQPALRYLDVVGRPQGKRAGVRPVTA
jgi:hypothetical protein